MESSSSLPSGSSSIPEALPITWRSTASTEEYERARVGRVFNLRRPDRYPIAVVEATCEDHVIAAVKIARENNARVSVRSGGHSWAVWSVRDETVLIDLGNYQKLEFDDQKMIAIVSPSTTGRILNGFLLEKGMIFAGGHCPDVGLGGFLLQGGMGWCCRGWGWAAQYVLAIDVVTAAGEKLHCSPVVNSDLYWAARGGGPGFPAVVTKFYLQARLLPTHMRCSAYIYPKSEFKTALNWVKYLALDYDNDTEIVCVSNTPPGGDDHVILVSFLTFKWSEAEAKAALQRAEKSHPPGTIESWFCRETSLPCEYKTQGEANPNGHRYCAENAYIENDSDVASILEEAFTSLPSKKSFALWYSMAPTSRRPWADDMALSLHSDHYFALYTIWEDAKDDDICQGWVKDVMKKVEKHSIGSYLGDADMQVRRTRFWSEKAGKRLNEVRKKYNPDGVVCGYLDEGDKSGADGLPNLHEWEEGSSETERVNEGLKKLVVS